jgi:hypothetical protein
MAKMEAVEEGTCTVMYFVNMVKGEPDGNESGEDDLAMRAWKTRQEAARLRQGQSQCISNEEEYVYTLQKGRDGLLAATERRFS